MPSVNPLLGKGLKLDMSDAAAALKLKKSQVSVKHRSFLQWLHEKLVEWRQLSMTADRLDRICRVLFPMTFFVFNVFYWWFFAFSVD